MPHLEEEDLILHYYSEPGNDTREEHLAMCPECRERWRALQLSLNSLNSLEVPEPAPDFEQRLAAKLTPQLGLRHRRQWLRWALPAFATAALAFAFWIGRTTHQPDGVTAIAYLAPDAALRAAALTQLERSQLILVEAANWSTANRGATLPRERAEDLLASSRLLRNSARARGQLQIAELLEEVERILLEITHSSPSVTPQEATALQARIQEQGLLFRVRSLAQQIQANPNPTEVPSE